MPKFKMHLLCGQFFVGIHSLLPKTIHVIRTLINSSQIVHSCCVQWLICLACIKVCKVCQDVTKPPPNMNISCLLPLFSHQNGSESFKLILDLFLLSWSITGKICHFQNSFWIPFCEEKISGNTKVDFAEGQIVPRNTSFEQNI